MPKSSCLGAFAQAAIQGRKHSQEPHGILSDQVLAQKPALLCVSGGSSRIIQMPVTSTRSSTSHKHQAQELALSVELGLASESAQVLGSPTNLSEDSHFTETFSSF